MSKKKPHSKAMMKKHSPVKVVEKPAAIPAVVEDGVAKKGVRVLQPLRGMRDILPKEGESWLRLYQAASAIAETYGFQFMETPILEEAALFVRSIGRGTDVVEKEMYVFEDKDGARVGLRPEFTASVARAYINHGLHTVPQPVKAWLYGPLFRHNRPQAGRYRQFHQFGCETLGERDPFLDAELIVLAYNFFRDLGLAITVHLNSIGTLEDRGRYIVELSGYLKSKRSYLCEDCKRRLQRNPLRVLDCKEPECIRVVEEAPQILDWLSDASKQYFMKVIEYLDELSVPYLLRSTLVRGLDYYTDTVFEFYAESAEAGAQSALGGGGRYDLLVEQLGGRPTPACGFAIGLERVLAAMRSAGSPDPALRPSDPAVPSADGGRWGDAERLARVPKFFLAHLGEQARRRALAIFEDLRRAKVAVRQHLGKPSLKTQLELSNRVGATHTLILGQKEVQDGTIIIRDMESGIQEIVPQKRLAAELGKILAAPAVPRIVSPPAP